MGITLNEYVEKAMDGVKIEEASTASAEVEYSMRMKDIMKALDTLKKKLKNHEKNFKSDGSTNWGYPGDLGRIKTNLDDITKFMM